VVLFKTLTLAEIEQIVDLQTADLARRLAERGIRLELSEAARHYIARQGYDPVYGARPLKRYLQHQLETRIGRALVSGEVVDGSLLEVGLENGELTVRSEAPPAPEPATEGEAAEEPEVVEAEIVA
jgi:ATP-dependent Clp protease ATP-binding subunit ClpB